MSSLRQEVEKINKIPLEHFVYVIPTNQFIHLPTRQPWVPAGVNAALGRVQSMKATDWLKENRAVMELPDKESA